MGNRGWWVACAAAAWAGCAGSIRAQSSGPGGAVFTSGHVILLELGPEDVVPGNLLDLQGRTLRFTPEAGGYRVSNITFAWDSTAAQELSGVPSAQVMIQGFRFPFAGSTWGSLYVGTHGNITFGADQSAFYDPQRDRHLLMRHFAGSMTNTVPLIAPLFRKLGVFDPDNVGRRHVREESDRLVVTWEMSEPYRDVFAFTGNPRMNRFQAVLHADGTIDFSYDLLSVQDGIVGVFPVDPLDRASWTLPDPAEPELPAYLDVTALTAALVEPGRLRFAFQLRGPPLPAGDARNDEMLYRVFLDTDAPFTEFLDFGESDADFGVFGDAPSFDHFTYSPFVDLDSLVLKGNSLAFEVSTEVLGGATTFSYFADTPDFDQPPPNFDHTAAHLARLPQMLAAAGDPHEPQLPGHLDIRSLAISRVGNHSLRFSWNVFGVLLPEGDPRVERLLYRVHLGLSASRLVDFGVSGASDLRYHTYGPGISPNITMDGGTLSVLMPLSMLADSPQFSLYCDAVDFATGEYDQVLIASVPLPPLPSPRLDLSEAGGMGPLGPVLYEVFHFPDLPGERELSKRVIAALGDRFDFLAFFTDFRIDRQESGASFSGAIGSKVLNAVDVFNQPEDFGSRGQLQGVQLASWIDTPLTAPSGTDLSGSYTGYDREVTLLSHELGHRWLTLQEAMVNGGRIRIGDPSPHWLRELHQPVLHPHHQPMEASAMGGAFWQDHGDGTYTDQTQPFFQSGGYSPLDLYYMGFLPKESVPPFFLLQNPSLVGFDPQGRPVYSGSPLTITVDDVIAVKGPRLPEFPDTQRVFNLGLVGVVAPASKPSPLLLDRLAGIRDAFTRFWTRATGGVGRMHALVAGDFDADLDVDALDMALFETCITGPEVGPPAAACLEMDFDFDGDVDQSDFGLLQILFTGDGG